MSLYQYGIKNPCENPCENQNQEEEPVIEILGQQIGRCKLPNVSNPAYVPVYKPKNCSPDPVNYDRRRHDVVCKSNPSNSLPLSNDEYLRLKLKNGNRSLSNSFLVQTSADTGKYRTVVWTGAGTSKQASASNGYDLGVLKPVTAKAVDSTTLTQSRIAVAASGSLSALDVNGRKFDSTTTLRRMGLAIMSNPGSTQPCVSCDLHGTSASVYVGPCTCKVKYIN
jgi:hypothetical protein